MKLKRRGPPCAPHHFVFDRFQMSKLLFLCTCSPKLDGRRMMRLQVSRSLRRDLARKTLLLRCSSTFRSKYLAGTWLRAGHAVTTHCAPGFGRFGPVSGLLSSVPLSSGGSRSHRFHLGFSCFWCCRRSSAHLPGKLS